MLRIQANYSTMNMPCPGYQSFGPDYLPALIQLIAATKITALAFYACISGKLKSCGTYELALFVMLTQVAAWFCHCSWPDAWHSVQRLLPDGGTLCQQEHHQLGSWLCRQWLACLGSGSCAVSGTKAYQDQLHHPL